MSTPAAPTRPVLTVAYVPGVTCTKWRTIWAERFGRVRLVLVEVAEADQRRVLDEGTADLCFVRLPLDRDGLHLIPLYEERPVAWVSKDHVVAAVEQVTLAELADETVLASVTPFHIDLVALGEAVLAVPQSIARSYSRRDLVYRPIIDAPPTTIGVAWRTDTTNEHVDEFIGIVRGRTVNSSRTVRARAARGRAAR